MFPRRIAFLILAGLLTALLSIPAVYTQIVNNSTSSLTSEDSITLPVLSVDSIGNPTAADSFFVIVFKSHVNDVVFADSGTAAMTGLDTVRVGAVTYYYYHRAVSDIDGGGATGVYGLIVMAKKNSPVLRTANRLSFQIVDRELSDQLVVIDSAGIAARFAKNNNDSLGRVLDSLEHIAQLSDSIRDSVKKVIDSLQRVKDSVQAILDTLQDGIYGPFVQMARAASGSILPGSFRDDAVPFPTYNLLPNGDFEAGYINANWTVLTGTPALQTRDGATEGGTGRFYMDAPDSAELRQNMVLDTGYYMISVTTLGGAAASVRFRFYIGGTPALDSLISVSTTQTTTTKLIYNATRTQYAVSLVLAGATTTGIDDARIIPLGSTGVPANLAEAFDNDGTKAPLFEVDLAALGRLAITGGDGSNPSVLIENSIASGVALLVQSLSSGGIAAKILADAYGIYQVANGNAYYLSSTGATPLKIVGQADSAAGISVTSGGPAVRLLNGADSAVISLAGTDPYIWPSVQPQFTGLIRNGGFESWEVSSQPTGWTVVSGNLSTRRRYSSVGGDYGTGVAVGVMTGTACRYKQVFTMDTGAVMLSALGRNGSGNTSSVTLYNGGTTLATLSFANNAHEIQAKIANNATLSSVCSLVVVGAGTANASHFDDIMVIPVGPRGTAGGVATISGADAAMIADSVTAEATAHPELYYGPAGGGAGTGSNVWNIHVIDTSAAPDVGQTGAYVTVRSLAGTVMGVLTTTTSGYATFNQDPAQYKVLVTYPGKYAAEQTLTLSGSPDNDTVRIYAAGLPASGSPDMATVFVQISRGIISAAGLELIAENRWVGTHITTGQLLGPILARDATDSTGQAAIFLPKSYLYQDSLHSLYNIRLLEGSNVLAKWQNFYVPNQDTVRLVAP